MSPNEKKYLKLEQALLKVYLSRSSLEEQVFPLQLWYTFTMPKTIGNSLITFPLLRHSYELEYLLEEFFSTIDPKMLSHLLKTNRCSQRNKDLKGAYVYSLRVPKITPLEKVRLLSAI